MNINEASNIRELSLFFSSQCNMKCKYCYIEKNESKMQNYNNFIRKEIENGNYYNRIIERVGSGKNQITRISLWGAEPTINRDYFKKLIVDLFNYFGKVNIISFFSNTLLGLKALKVFYDTIEEYNKENNREIRLDLQTSIDGPEWINDYSRQKGATKNTVIAIEDFINYIPENSITKVKIDPKPTISCYFMNIMNEDKNLLKDWFCFFEKYHKKFKEISKNKNIAIYFLAKPTIVIPGEHTVEDGIIFKDWLKNLRTMDYSDLEYYKNKLPIYNQLYYAMKDIIYASDKSLFQISRSTSCGGGSCALGIGPTGDIFSCHKPFELSYNLTGDMKSVALGHSTLTSNTKKKELDDNRLLYLNSSYHDYNITRYSMAELIVAQLMLSGQIGKQFKNKELMKILISAMDGMTCFVGNVNMTKSSFIPSTSSLKLLGNGALEELLLTYNLMKGVIK